VTPVRDNKANLIKKFFENKKNKETKMKPMNDVNYGRLWRPISNGVKKKNTK